MYQLMISWLMISLSSFILAGIVRYLYLKNTFEDELADVIIRVLDLCAFKGIDIESHIKAKMRYIVPMSL